MDGLAFRLRCDSFDSDSNWTLKAYMPPFHHCQNDPCEDVQGNGINCAWGTSFNWLVNCGESANSTEVIWVNGKLPPHPKPKHPKLIEKQ